LLTFVALIIALANPVSQIEKNIGADVSKTQIVFALDVSKSMLATDVMPSRLQQAQNFIQQTIKSLNGEQIGMVLFAGKASPYFPFITDYAYAASSTASASNNFVLRQGTSLNEALKISSSYFNLNNKDVKILCVLSDGESHTDGFEKLSDSLRKAGINLFAFGAGTASGATIPVLNPDGTETIEKDQSGANVLSHLNQASLLRITGNNTGNYFLLSDKENTKNAFINNLKKLETNTLQKEWTQKGNFQLFLVIGLFFLVLEIVIKQIYVYKQK